MSWRAAPILNAAGLYCIYIPYNPAAFRIGVLIYLQAHGVEFGWLFIDPKWYIYLIGPMKTEEERSWRAEDRLGLTPQSPTS
jgi:hypothetical protein